MVDYSKWDKLEVSDEESKPKKSPVPEAKVRSEVCLDSPHVRPSGDLLKTPPRAMPPTAFLGGMLKAKFFRGKYQNHTLRSMGIEWRGWVLLEMVPTQSCAVSWRPSLLFCLVSTEDVFVVCVFL